jgi:serine protease
MTLNRLLVVSAAVVIGACGGAGPDESEHAQADEPEALVAPEATQRVHWMRGVQPPQGFAQAAGSNLVDNGGRVDPKSNIYAIWWGTQSAFPSDAKAGIQSLFQGLNGSSFYNIANQYMRGATVSATYKGTFTDTSAPPRRSPSTSAIVNEACKTINANGLTADPNGMYVVYTSNFPRGTGFCAWHDNGTCNGVNISVFYMPNTTGQTGCDPGNTFSCNSYSEGTRSLANVTSHEFMEATTDQLPSTKLAWVDSAGSEIGDKCAWQFSSCVSLSTGKWQLQQEWSNAVSGCQQQ